MENVFEYFASGNYDKVIELGEKQIDSSVLNNYYVLVSLVIKDDIYRALSFINRSKIIKENLCYLEEGGTNYTTIATLSKDEDKIEIAMLLFMCNFINSIFKEMMVNKEKEDHYYFIRFNEMIDDLYCANCSKDLLSELTNISRLLF